MPTAPATRRFPGCSSATRTNCATWASRWRPVGCRSSTPPRATASTATPTRCRPWSSRPTRPPRWRWRRNCGNRPELITATQGALLKLRAAGVDVDASDAGVAITSTAALPGLRGSEDVLGILLSAINSGRAVQFPHRPARSEPYTIAHRRAVGRGHRQGPLVSRRPRPRPRRHPHVPAFAHRRRGDGHRSARRGAAARRGQPARDRRPGGGRHSDRNAGQGVGRRRPRHRAAAPRRPSWANGSWVGAMARRSRSTSA